MLINLAHLQMILVLITQRTAKPRRACADAQYHQSLRCSLTQHDKTNKVTVRPANLGIRPVWSESSLCAQWIAKDPSFLPADSEDSNQIGRMFRLIWVFARRTRYFVGFVTRWLILNQLNSDKMSQLWPCWVFVLWVWNRDHQLVRFLLSLPNLPYIADIDECSTGTPCNTGVCNNTPGTYTCDCTGTGFDGATCSDRKFSFYILKTKSNSLVIVLLYSFYHWIFLFLFWFDKNKLSQLVSRLAQIKFREGDLCKLFHYRVICAPIRNKHLTFSHKFLSILRIWTHTFKCRRLLIISPAKIWSFSSSYI